MSFESFATAHGLIISNLELNKWTRVPTVDHPHKRNGAYIFDGERGAVQNWATHEKPVTWFSGEKNWLSDEEYRRKRAKADKDKAQSQERAAAKAGWILKQSSMSHHPYLDAKGFQNEKGNVWNGLLVIPTRLNGKLTGCQLISPAGDKKFLKGQLTKGVHCGFDNKGVDVLVEGYATGLSVRRALKASRTRYKIWVCFSAGNLVEVAKGLKNALVIADNDLKEAGLLAAKKTGFPYWMSSVVGEDANDAEKRMGTEKLGMELARLLP